MPTPSTSNVANFLANAIRSSPKTQKQISREVGFPAANFLSMVKTGESKLPVNRVPALAKALGVSPQHLLRLCLEEYEPELLDVIDRVLPGGFLTDDEEFLVLVLRSVYSGKAVAASP